MAPSLQTFEESISCLRRRKRLRVIRSCSRIHSSDPCSWFEVAIGVRLYCLHS